MTKDEKRHVGRTVALGCIACRQDGFYDTPAEAHHPREGAGVGKRASHYDVLPLCEKHHRGTMHPIVSSIHLDKLNFIKKYGSEAELLEKVKNLIALQ